MNEPNYHLTGVLKTRDEAAEDFDGPLDVILLLLSKNKIEIQDVSITAILEQYLGYLDEMKRMDMEIASEFIAMASHLMLIKTKMLLSAAEQAEAQSEMEQLIQSLQERQRQEALEKLRSAAQELDRRSELGLGSSPSSRSPSSGIKPTATATSPPTCCGPSRPSPSGAASGCPRPGAASRASWAGSPTP